MFTKITSSSIVGIEAIKINIEADISMGLLQWNIVGLPDIAVKESKQRIISAIKNSGIKLPDRRITINLSPADLKKEGSCFDLPITLAILQAYGIISLPDYLKNDSIIIGEIALDGSLIGNKGIFIIASEMKKLSKKYLIVPLEIAEEAALIEEIIIIAPKNLQELIVWITTEQIQFFKSEKKIFKKEKKYDLNLSEVQGNAQAKRALEIAAAGMHSILFIGSPGSGKTMLSERFPYLLPEMNEEEKIENSKIYSSIGKLNSKNLISSRPFISPHHTISQVGLSGGGSFPKPGAISLANNGVLFLDELLEYKKSCLEILRQPMESGKITISRSSGETTFPAKFILIAATNPCPCGYYGDTRNTCLCSKFEIQKYLKKLSGPLLDRIDLHVGVYAEQKINEDSKNESSEEIYKKIKIAIENQKKRFNCENKFNGKINGSDIKNLITISNEVKKIIDNAYEKLSLSMRSYYKTIKTARTIADLENQKEISPENLIEALSFRKLDRLKI
jgi:magnesium chelatase family protein